MTQDERSEERIRSSFARQGLMQTLGASVERVAPGQVEIAMRPNPAISQQHGFTHAGAVSAIADSAARYAALTLMPSGSGVLTTEFKIWLLPPGIASWRIVDEAMQREAAACLDAFTSLQQPGKTGTVKMFRPKAAKHAARNRARTAPRARTESVRSGCVSV